MRETRSKLAVTRRNHLLGAMVAASAAMLLPGCGAFHNNERGENYANDELMQSSANRIANLAVRDNVQSVRRVQLSLYRRNPREWRKWATSPEDAITKSDRAICFMGSFHLESRAGESASRLFGNNVSRST